MKIITKEIAINLGKAMSGLSYLEARKIIIDAGIDNKTSVLREAFPYIVLVIESLYNPSDKGKDGKVAEIEERLNRWYDSKRPVCRWFELHARRNGENDLNKHKSEEMKTGAGDWLYSKTGYDRESIITEYRSRQSLIYWKTEEFTIRCTWKQLFDYMDTYNEKGCEQFFKVNVKYNPQVEKTVVMLQEWKTSKKKIAFFKACPYNMEKEEEEEEE